MIAFREQPFPLCPGKRFDTVSAWGVKGKHLQPEVTSESFPQVHMESLRNSYRMSKNEVDPATLISIMLGMRFAFNFREEQGVLKSFKGENE